MTFDELVDFIQNRMRLSHVYQPLLIRTLIDSAEGCAVRFFTYFTATVIKSIA